MYRSRKQYFHYVCADCLRPLPSCCCEEYPPKRLVYLKKPLQEGAVVLWTSGWLKAFSYHSEPDGSRWTLLFRRPVPEEALRRLPEGFSWEGGGLTCCLPDDTDAPEPLQTKQMASALSRWAQALAEAGGSKWKN